MKKHTEKPIVHITDPEIEKYAEEMTSPESEALQALVESSDTELEYIDMISGKLVGQLLKTLIKISGAKRILEVGTFTGYSALTMAEALPGDGEVITMEMNMRYQEIAERHFEQYDTLHKITMLKGNAIDLLDEVEGEFDMAFLDADKLQYEVYYKKILPKLKKGGFLIADNALWDGTVLEPHDPKSKAIDAFNRQLAADPGVEQVLLPLRDGVTIIRKK